MENQSALIDDEKRLKDQGIDVESLYQEYFESEEFFSEGSQKQNRNLAVPNCPSSGVTVVTVAWS